MQNYLLKLSLATALFIYDLLRSEILPPRHHNCHEYFISFFESSDIVALGNLDMFKVRYVIEKRVTMRKLKLPYHHFLLL